MKTYRMNFNVVCGVLLCLMFSLSSCDDDDDDVGIDDPITDLVTLQEVALTGAEEVPANTSAATGTFRGTYNPDTRRIAYTITFQGMTPIAMHFHRGAVGVAGPIEVPINPGSDPYSGTNPYVSPLSGSTPALSAAQEADLMAGNWYINVHSDLYPDGEIRGQIRPE